VQHTDVLLTNDQLHEEHVFWSWGGNPFEWAPRTVDDDRERATTFSTWLAAHDPDVPWDRVAETLLNRDIGKPRARRTEATGYAEPSNEGTTAEGDETSGSLR
jgi:hypothetical protein